MLGVGDELSVVGQCGRESHVDGDSVAVAEGCLWDQFMQWRPGVAIGDDTIEANLVEVGCFQSEHLVNPFEIDLIRGVDQFFGGSICSAE